MLISTSVPLPGAERTTALPPARRMRPTIDSRTPPLSEHVLDSITRRIVMDIADVAEVQTTLADLERADEAFVASSMREVIAVGRIEERALAEERPVTDSISEQVSAHIQAELAAGTSRRAAAVVDQPRGCRRLRTLVDQPPVRGPAAQLVAAG